MSRAYLFLLAILPFASSFANTQSSSEYQIVSFAEKQQSLIPAYLRDLEVLGYCVIPNVFSKAETEALYQRV